MLESSVTAMSLFAVTAVVVTVTVVEPVGIVTAPAVAEEQDPLELVQLKRSAYDPARTL